MKVKHIVWHILNPEEIDGWMLFLFFLKRFKRRTFQMKDRLKQRREQRRKAEEERRRKESEDRYSSASDGVSSGGSRPGTRDSQAVIKYFS